jgi:hypothetical protein
VLPKVKHLGVCTLSSTILPTAFVIILILVYSFCKVFLILGKAPGTKSIEKYISLFGGNQVFLGIHLQTLAILKNIQGLVLLSFLVPPHELHTIENLS